MCDGILPLPGWRLVVFGRGVLNRSSRPQLSSGGFRGSTRDGVASGSPKQYEDGSGFWCARAGFSSTRTASPRPVCTFNCLYYGLCCYIFHRQNEQNVFIERMWKLKISYDVRGAVLSRFSQTSWQNYKITKLCNGQHRIPCLGWYVNVSHSENVWMTSGSFLSIGIWKSGIDGYRLSI